MKSTRCILCGKPLTSAKSQIRGYGSGCSAKLMSAGFSGSQMKSEELWQKRLNRYINYSKGLPISIGSTIWTKNNDGYWISTGVAPIHHNTFGEFLIKTGQVVRANQVNKDVLETVLQDGLEGLVNKILNEGIGNNGGDI